MVHHEVEDAVKRGDISSLKYHFCDCLDGDPTFSEYEDDYEYCKSKGVLFVPHSELHPMNCNSVTEEYWVQLKKDFMQNPSIKRMEHMREVAKILYGSRIRKIEEAKARPIASRPDSKSTQFEPAKQISQPASHSGAQADISSSKPLASDGIRRVSELARPKYDAGHTVNGYNGSDGIRRTKEPIDDGVSSTSGTRRTISEAQDKPTKKANGMGGIVAALVTVLVVLVVIVAVSLINK